MAGGSCVEAGTPNPADPCQACLPVANGNGWSQDDANVTCDSLPYWAGVQRSLPRTPYDHENAVSCHNCYASSLSATLDKIHAAQASGADLIELDIKDEGGTVYVQHDDTGSTSAPRFAEVLADPGLKAGNQLLFIETKETAPSESYLRAVLDQLAAAGYGVAGRPVVLRTFDSLRDNLIIARKLLATPTYAAMRPHVRLHVLFPSAEGADVAALQTKVAASKQRGFHGVEFEYRTPNLFGALAYAKSLGMGTSLWTLPVSMGEAFIAALRDEVDALTVDYPVSQARAVIQDDNALVYLNAWDQPATASSVRWFGSSHIAVHQAPVNVGGSPTTESLPVGEDRFGTSLVFDAAASQSLTFLDADASPAAGYLVATVVNFDALSLPEGETQMVLGKANAGGFALELHNPAGAENTILRFGVYVDGAYRYATYPASGLGGSESYLVIGAYDGDGSVRLWVNNSETGTTTAGPFAAGVGQNDVPILLGADPEVGPARFFFSGKVQMALVQEWGNH
jgi:glycerophosphoryl diester phosphodiesterase